MEVIKVLSEDQIISLKTNLNTVQELTNKSETDMMKVRNLGRKSLDEVKAKLADLGLSLRHDD